jgi:glycerol-3-phosphate dehydrogenase
VRIALDALFDARRIGASVHKYTRVENLERVTPGGRWRLSPRATGGHKAEQGETAHVTASVVLSLARARVDELCNATGQIAGPKCTGIKGIYIAVRLTDDFVGWGVFDYISIGEPVYCLPWRRFHYIRLTRTPFDGDMAGVFATDQEVDWMIAETNRSLARRHGSDQTYCILGPGYPLTHDADNRVRSREIKILGPGTGGRRACLPLPAARSWPPAGGSPAVAKGVKTDRATRCSAETQVPL